MAEPRLHIALNAHLLHGGATYRSAGIHQYIHGLLRHLPAVDPGLALTVFTGAGAPALAHTQMRRSRWPTHRPLVRLIWEQVAQPGLLAQLRPDLLHSLAFASPLVNPAPAVVTVYDLSFRLFPDRFPPLQRLYLSAITGLSCRRARRVIAISESTRRDVARLLRVPAEQVDVAYPGVDARFRPAPAAEVEAFRQRQGLPAQFILYLGTLEPRKNLGTLITAYAAWRARHPARRACHLVLAGAPGWGYAALSRQVAELNLSEWVHFPGYVPAEDLPMWYNAGAVFVYPSSFEGFGMPVAEALACARPVITSDASSLPEAAGAAALRVPPGSAEALAAALEQAFAEAPALAQLGPAQAARFTWEATARRTAASYRAALAPRA